MYVMTFRIHRTWGRTHSARLLLRLFFCFFAGVAHATPFDCTHPRCGLPGDGPYHDIVVGRIAHEATDKQAAAIFRWARAHGYWKGLPADVKGFQKTVQIMAVEIQGPQGPKDLTLLMGRPDFEAVGIAVGDTVRFRPHPSTAGSPETQASDPYWQLFGCIAVLCRAEDRACARRYVPGIYRHADGVALDADSGAPIHGGIRIDTGTYLPLTARGK